jgi:hypothetical protein
VLLTQTHLAIVMEYAAGGELFERICSKGRFGRAAPPGCQMVTWTRETEREREEREREKRPYAHGLLSTGVLTAK